MCWQLFPRNPEMPNNLEDKWTVHTEIKMFLKIYGSKGINHDKSEFASS